MCRRADGCLTAVGTAEIAVLDEHQIQNACSIEALDEMLFGHAEIVGVFVIGGHKQTPVE